MTKIDTQVQLDAAVLARVDAAAERLGRSRDEMIEDSVRRDLAGQLLGGIFKNRPADAPELDDQQVTELVYDELDQARQDRPSTS